MTLKSFKSKRIEQQLLERQFLAEHLRFSGDRIDIHDFSVVGVTLDNDDWNGRPLTPSPLETSGLTPGDIVLGDTLALTIGSDPQVFMARVADVVQLSKTRKVMLGEYTPTQLPLRSSKSKQTLSPGWTNFLKELKELKKKCGSNGHHNKKKKTLLHVVKVARGITARQECFQLTVRQPQEEALRNARVIEDGKPDLVEKIEEAIAKAEKAGKGVSLNEIAGFPYQGLVAGADYLPQRAAADAMTLVVNGAELIRGLVGQKETIRISKELLDNAATFSTGAGFGLDLASLLDPKVKWNLTAYGHEKALTMHDMRAIRTISVSKDDRFYTLELERNLEARAQWDNKNDYYLVAISGSKAVLDEAVEHPILAPELEKDYGNYDRTLAISSGMYKFLKPDSKDDTPQLQITEQLRSEALSRFEEGHPYLISVGNTHSAAYRVKSVKIDAVKTKATVKFDYQRGSDFELLREDRVKGKRKQLIMKRALSASEAKYAAITLTVENGQDMPVVDVDEPAAALLDDYVDGDLEEIVAGIKELLLVDPDKYVSLSELASWIAEKELPVLDVTGVEYWAPQKRYGTSSSVSDRVDIETWESKDRKYSFVDIPDIGNVNSIQHISGFVYDKKAPVSKVKERRLVDELEEIRKAYEGAYAGARDAYAGDSARYGYVSIYNGENGHGVCDNEQIWRVLRKKKDGKCIYRIVVKKGARANRIAHGKHRKCVVYIDRLYRVNNPVF
jgi:hypothetical protein